MKTLCFAVLLFCLQAVLPFHRPDNPSRPETIMAAPCFLGKICHQIILQLHGAGVTIRMNSPEIKLLDHDEEFGQARSSVGYDTVPTPTRFTTFQEEFAEGFLETPDPMSDVAAGNAFNLGRAGECLLGVDEALVDDRDPKKNVRERYRVSAALGGFLAEIGGKPRRRDSRSSTFRSFDLLFHPGANLGTDDVRIANESLKSRATLPVSLADNADRGSGPPQLI